MKIVFLTNNLVHHQTDFCEKMSRELGNGFHVVVLTPLAKNRQKIGYRELNDEYPFVVRTYESAESDRRALDLSYDADAVIWGTSWRTPWGSYPEKYIERRRADNKLTFVYIERIFKRGTIFSLLPSIRKRMRTRYVSQRERNQFYLCASGYAASDINRFTKTPDKFFRWGYFPPREKDSWDALLAEKKKNPIPTILWVGRFIDWKHSDYAVRLGKRLFKKGLDFKIKMIGGGELFERVRNSVPPNLTEKIELSGVLPPDKTRQEMRRADILIATSDFQEGWGAVVNEGMNSGCAVVASHAMGSVPFLIKDGENGFIFRSGDLSQLTDKVARLLTDSSLRERMGAAAYRTIDEVWNAENAGNRLLALTEAFLNGRRPDFGDDGPCSPAPILSNHWFKG